MKVIKASAGSVFVDCVRDPIAAVSGSRNCLCSTAPEKRALSLRQTSLVEVVLCHWNEMMRFFVLAPGSGGVVRRDSCLQCCITYCRLMDLPVDVVSSLSYASFGL
jgi:hypothetical protein